MGGVSCINNSSGISKITSRREWPIQLGILRTHLKNNTLNYIAQQQRKIAQETISILTIIQDQDSALVQNLPTFAETSRRHIYAT